jgi:putative flavoprotein involved in K+ transport
MPTLATVTTVVIGAGHAGLAMSHRLTERSIDHVVLERGEVANSWRTERWESLRLLTPNAHNHLPGLPDCGKDPDGFMTMPEVVRLIDGYAAAVDAPVVTGTTVTRVAPVDDGYEVTTDRGTWRCATVVLASGAANLVSVPPFGEAVPSSIATLTPLTYRSPGELPDGGVLVVGGSATGVQLADELHRSGRPVTLSVGGHVRMPRTYRGRDVFWWLDASGVLDERHDQVDDLVRARHVPSPQLIGTPERRTIDLTTLQQLGVEIVGRLGSIRDGVGLCSGGLANACRLADLKLDRLLDRFDRWANDARTDIAERPYRLPPTQVPADTPLEVDLRRRNIGTIVWATGYRPDHSWLDVPVLDGRNRIRHEGGIVHGAAGLYVLGGSLLRTRRSSYLGGAAGDTSAIADHITGLLSNTRPPTPRPGLLATAPSKWSRSQDQAIPSSPATDTPPHGAALRSPAQAGGAPALVAVLRVLGADHAGLDPVLDISGLEPAVHVRLGDDGHGMALRDGSRAEPGGSSPARWCAAPFSARTSRTCQTSAAPNRRSSGAPTVP